MNAPITASLTSLATTLAEFALRPRRHGPSPEKVGFLVGSCVGALIAVVGFVVAAVFVIRWANRKMAEQERNAPIGPPPDTAMIPLFYVLSILFWPVGFAAGAHLLGHPATARAGRNCVAIGAIVVASVAVLTAVAIVIVAIVFADELPLFT